MNVYIAYCGPDCESCEARPATVNNDNALRQQVAGEWSELNGEVYLGMRSNRWI